MLFAVESDVPFKMDGKTPIALVTLDPVVYTVKADSPWKTLADVAGGARANPKTFRYGIAGVSGVAGFSVSQFLFAANVPSPRRTRSSSPAARRPSPRSPAATSTSRASSGASRRGSSRAARSARVAVVHPTRLPGMPDIPTAKEAGFPELNVVGWQGWRAEGPAARDRAEVERCWRKRRRTPRSSSRRRSSTRSSHYLPPDPYWKFQEDALKNYLPLATKMGIRK